jgi:4-hydroxy-2-oxoheptanedioate aldolase
VLNGYISMASPAAAELYAMQGWDAITIDMEHGSIGFDAAVDILRAVSASGAIPLARIPHRDPALIGMLLDAGILGITCAMINTRADAESLVRACRYTPDGMRGLSRQTRAAYVHGPDYTQTANERISVFAMIETKEGMDNLEEITAVPGIDGIYFGGVDYSMSLRHHALPRTCTDSEIESEVGQAAGKIIDRCQSVGILSGMNAKNAKVAAQLLEKGFRFITLSSDANAMISQSKAWVDEARALGSDFLKNDRHRDSATSIRQTQ